MDRILAIWKPKGPTSHDMIDKIRKITREQTVGHAGTLDPLASGILVIGIGREATRKLKDMVQKEKEYIAKIRLGVTSTTDDEEGTKLATSDQRPATSDEIKNAVPKFIGRIMQTPPAYSAVKIEGRRAYKSARRGEIVKLKPREVEIKNIEILEYTWPYLKLRVLTGPGVYIRALARDLGKALGVGGYLADLERTRVGNFTKKDSVGLEEFSELK